MTVFARHLAAVALGIAGTCLADVAVAQDYWSMSCAQLWYERNAIYKAHGYCFKTDRAIRTFGNEGCNVADESALAYSPQARRTVALIVQVERQKYCR